ncbi:tetratricopeptide repeat protein 38-like [Branchiostoma lanceolatum]|uniref:tetratricopeptide repeat protein 38-like n=1 Tax=Branchiostoma lanceolatum TaxID=7740 RepID=UPI00345628C1
MLACHNYWHWAVYHIEKGEYTAALDIYDNECGVRSKGSGPLLDIVDSCSLLYRLNMEGVDVGSRWEDLYETCRPHADDHILIFNDLHVLMSCLGAKQDEAAKKLVNALKSFVSEHQGTQSDIAKKFGVAMCEAFLAYDKGDFAKAVDLLAPVRYQVVTIGGSNAQRDLFNLFLIHAAIKSSEKRHHRLARNLLLERKALKKSAPMTDRLIAKAMAMHGD